MAPSTKNITPLRARFQIGWFLLFLAFVLCPVSRCLANDAVPIEYVTMQEWTVRDGLSNRFVKVVIKDNQGFMWLGTTDGLNRFDGYQFKAYNQSTSGMHFDEIKHIVQAPDSMIWFTCDQGLFLLDPITEAIYSGPEYFGDQLPLKQQPFLYILEGLGGILLGSMDSNVFIYQPSKGFEFAFSQTTAYAHYNFLAVGDEDVWISYFDSTILHVQLNKDPYIIPLEHLPWLACPVGQDGVIFLREGQDQNGHHSFYISSTDHQVKPLDAVLPQVIPGMHQPGTTWSYFRDDPSSSILMTNAQGIWVYDHVQDHLTRVMMVGEGELPQGGGILYAEKKSIWPITWKGIACLKLASQPFHSHLSYPPKHPLHLTHSMRGLLVVDSLLYASAYSGTRVINLNNGTTERLKFPGQEAEALNYFEFQYAMHQGRHGKLWLAGAHLLQYDPATGSSSVHQFPKEAELLVYSLYEDQQSNVWQGTSMGLWYYDPVSDTIQRFGFAKENFDPGYIYYIKPVGDDAVWLCTDKGMAYWHLGSKTFQQYSKQDTGTAYLPAQDIRYTHIDSDGIHWLATANQGLFQWDPRTGAYTQYTIKEGLAANDLYAIYEDTQQQLWISSVFGLMLFDKEQGYQRTYLSRHGTAYDEFNALSHAQAADGTLFFGGLNGITYFHPDSIRKQGFKDQPSLEWISFEKLNTNGQLVDQTPTFLKTREIVLQPGEKSFQVKAALLDYQPTYLHRYTYRLKGLDKDWHPQHDNTLRINGLPYGDYVLEIKAFDQNGTEAANSLSVPVRVLKPYWLQWWFIVMGILAIASFIWWRFYRIRQAKHQLEAEVEKRTEQIRNDKEVIEQQALRLKELDAAKSRFFANVSHDLRTPLTLILGAATQIVELGDQPEKRMELVKRQMRNGKQLQQQIEALLDIARLDAGQLKIKNENVCWPRMIRQVVAAYESLVEYNQINYKLHLEPDDDLWVEVDRFKAEAILNNLLSNALRYTPKKGSITVRSWTSDEQLNISVQDSGPGIDTAEQGKVFERFFQGTIGRASENGGMGIGLSISKEYAQMMGGDLFLDSQPGAGSTFTLTLPIHQTAPGNMEPEQDAFPIHLPAPTPEKNEETTTIPSETILVVEDNPDMMAYLIGLLEGSYQVLKASNGKEALACLAGHDDAVHLILSDVMMPEMDGFTLLKKVRSAEEWLQIPFILLTARAGLEDKLNALRIGVDDYIAKPFEPRELKARIKNLLANLRERPVEKAPFSSVETAKDARIGPADLQWLSELEQHVKSELRDTQFNITQLAHHMAISERQMRRKLKLLTGLAPNKYVQEVRLQKARELLESGSCRTLKEVCAQIGIDTTLYLSRKFEERFGKHPSSYFEVKFLD